MNTAVTVPVPMPLRQTRYGSEDVALWIISDRFELGSTSAVALSVPLVKLTNMNKMCEHCACVCARARV